MWKRRKRQVLSNENGQPVESAESVGLMNLVESETAIEPANEVPSVKRDPQQESKLHAIEDEIHRQVIGAIDLSSVSMLDEEDLQFKIRFNADMLLKDLHPDLSPEEQAEIIEHVLNETFGFGPLESLLHDPSVTDIMVNGFDTVYVERGGRLERTPIRFKDNDHVVRIIQRIVGRMGRRIDETSPMVDGRLPDGSRINAIIPPLALDGPLVSIRRFGAKPLDANDLVSNDSMRKPMLDFLAACVRGRLNVLISGGTGSGKTTLLNVLSSYIYDDERVATIEDAAELILQQSHVIRMETRPANIEGEGEVATRDLVRNALRMRPDRIVVGECRGGEALDMLQAMNTGHDGSLTTVHANTPRDAMMRLEMMVGMTGIDIPVWTIRRQVASAIHIVVQVARISGGPRKVTRISEVTGMEGEVLTMHDIFEFNQLGIDENRVAHGEFVATGICPRRLPVLQSSGQEISAELFHPRVLD